MAVLRLKMLKGPFDASGAELQVFATTALAERYSPLLTGSLKFQAAVLSVEASTLEPPATPETRYGPESVVYAEIFPSPHGVVALELAETERGFRRLPDGSVVAEASGAQLTLYGIGSEQIAQPLAEIGGLLTERFGVELGEYRDTNRQFAALREDGRVPPDEPTAEEEASARLLTDDVVRQAAIGIASSGGLLRQDLPKHLGDAADRSAEIERRLQESPLVDVELVVTCKRRSTQVARAPSRDALRVMAETGLKCACGRNVMDERVDEALTLTPHGRKMLSASYWMTVLVIGELRELGVRLEDMLIEQVSGGDEMDFFADVSGELFLIELKDKEFSLGNAYSFGSKTGIYQPAYPVIVTSAYVGNDAKEHFRQAALARRATSARFDPFDGTPGSAGSGPEYVEGIAHLHDRLEHLVGRVYESDAGEALVRLMPRASASGRSVVRGIGAVLRQAATEPRAEPAPVDAQQP